MPDEVAEAGSSVGMYAFACLQSFTTFHFGFFFRFFQPVFFFLQIISLTCFEYSHHALRFWRLGVLHTHVTTWFP